MTNTITVTYGRKQPGPQEYSSESLTLSITRDLGPEVVQDQEIQAAIESLFQMLKHEVDRRLPAPSAVLPPRPQLPPAIQPMPAMAISGANANGQGGRLRSYGGNSNGNGRHASPKQVQYLLSLANQRGVGFDSLAEFLQGQTGKRDPYALTPDEASRVIDSLKA